MGRKQEEASDPSLAHAHEKGASVTIIQTLEHGRLGSLAYAWPRFWNFHWVIASEAAANLRALHEQLVHFPVSSARRVINDYDFLGRTFRCGCECVINAVLAVQHLCNEVERETHTEDGAAPIIERVSAANNAAQLGIDRSGDSYAGFLDLVRIRDAIEHPRTLNTYNGRPGEWDQVPLAWMLSDRSLIAVKRWDEWFDAFVSAWEQYLVRRGPVVQTFDGVTRGVRSTRQYKKPPAREPDLPV